MDVGTADAFILEDELAAAPSIPRTLEAFRSAVDAHLAASPTRWEDTTRGMSGRVHVRVLERSETVVDTTNLDNPCESPAAARAYAMRWKSHGNPRGYRVEFAQADERFRCGGCGSPQRGTHYSGCPLAS
jgi:hypothetical protein